MGKYRDSIRFGHGRSDLTLLYGNPALLNEAGRELAAPFAQKAITKVLALDAQGFALGALAAHHLQVGLVQVRKGGKMAWKTRSVEVKDYSGTAKTLEIAVDALSARDRVLIVDDWSETGAQLYGAIQLAEQCGVQVIGAAFVSMDDPVRKDARFSSYLLHEIEHCG